MTGVQTCALPILLSNSLWTLYSLKAQAWFDRASQLHRAYVASLSAMGWLIVIGAVLVPGAAAPKLVTRKDLATMKRRAVLVDVAIDQGGCFETSRPTTHQSPTYLVDEIIHYCVANMPGAVPVTSSHALNHATLPFGLALAAKGLRALVEDPHLRAGLNIHRGQITNRAVAESQNAAVVAPEAALAA